MMLNKWCLSCCFLKWDQMVWIRPFLLINCSMNNDMQVRLANWTEASGNTQYNILAHRLYYHWEIAVICFATAMIVLIRGVQDLEKRDERVKRAYTEHLLFVILRERAGANPSSGRLQHHVQTLQHKAYTQTILHRAQQKDIWQLTCNVCIHLSMYASILNSVLAVHRTYITVLLYGRYYSLKNAMAPRVFSSFWDNSHADQYDAVCSIWSEHWQADPSESTQNFRIDSELSF